MSESAYQLTTGEWSKYVVYWRPAGILQCLPIFSMALSCQLYDELNSNDCLNQNLIIP